MANGRHGGTRIICQNTKKMTKMRTNEQHEKKVRRLDKLVSVIECKIDLLLSLL